MAAHAYSMAGMWSTEIQIYRQLFWPVPFFFFKVLSIMRNNSFSPSSTTFLELQAHLQQKGISKNISFVGFLLEGFRQKL